MFVGQQKQFHFGDKCKGAHKAPWPCIFLSCSLVVVDTLEIEDYLAFPFDLARLYKVTTLKSWAKDYENLSSEVWCYWEQLEEHIGTIGNLVHWEHY